MVIKALKKLSQVTAATLGLAVLAAMGAAPAQAANLQTFQISGTFASVPDGENLGYFGLPVDLQNGSFDGTYTVDVDLLPVSSGQGVLFNNFNLNLRNSSNNILLTFDPANADAGIIGNQIYFFDPVLVYGRYMSLSFDTPLTGVGIATGTEGIYLDISALVGIGNSYGAIATTSFITSSTSQAVSVPEPVSIVGIGLAGSVVLFLKRKQQKNVNYVKAA